LRADVPAENVALHKLRCRRAQQLTRVESQHTLQQPRRAPNNLGRRLTEENVHRSPRHFESPMQRCPSQPVCNTPRPALQSRGHTTRPNSAASGESGVGVKHWSCPKCACSNKSGRTRCAVCGERFSKETVRGLLTSPSHAIVAESVETSRAAVVESVVATGVAAATEPTKELNKASFHRKEAPRTSEATDREGKECPICFEEFLGDTDRLFLPCCHSFHTSCVDIWLNTRGTCPTCRHPTTGSGIDLEAF